MENNQPNPKIILKLKNSETPETLTPIQTAKFTENYKKIKVSKILETVGNQNKYQYFIFYSFCFIFLTMGFFGNLLAYTYYVPDFYCQNAKGENFKCSQKEACLSKNFFVKKTRESVITEFELYCNENMIFVASSQSFIFIFSAVLTFLVAVISDKIGRKMTFYIMMVFFFVGSILSIFSEKFVFLSLGLAFTWTATDIFYTMSSTYFNEICSNYLRSKVIVFYFISAAGGIAMNGILFFITSYRSFYIFCFLNTIIFSLVFTQIIESPYFGFSSGDILKFYKILEKISTFNENPKTSQIKSEIGFQSLTNSEISEIQTLKYENNLNFFHQILHNLQFLFKNYSTKLILSIFFLCNIYINSCMTQIMPQKLGINNIYIMSTLFAISDLIGFLIMIPISHTIKRRKLNITCNIIILTSAFLLYLNEFNKGSKRYVFVSTFLSCVLKICTSAAYSLAFNYLNELFPTNIRGLSTGIIVCCARLSNCTATSFDYLSGVLNIHPLILTAVTTLFSLPASYALPETLNKNMKN